MVKKSYANLSSKYLGNILNLTGINQTAPKPNLEPSYELSYLLGVLKGDACLYKTKSGDNFEYVIQLAVTNKEFAQYFIDILEEIFYRRVGIITYRDDRNELFYKVVIRSKDFYEWYKSKTEIEMYDIANKYPNAFIKGVFDSEGNLSYYKHKYKDKIYVYHIVRIVSSNQILITKIKDILSRYEIDSTIQLRKPIETVINGRTCRFKKDIYVLGIYKREHVMKFYNVIGNSIGSKIIGG